MYTFVNDYSEGACEEIIAALTRTNREQTPGYSMDPYCEDARKRILALLDSPVSCVHFLVGGTQANLTVISACLRPHQGVISADSGHINVHESGAIESTGHKVLTIPSPDGKVRSEEVEALITAHFQDANFEHMVQPGMLYLSNPTEVGTIYTKDELTKLYNVCHRHGIPLFMDGARLGCALTCPENDLTLHDLTNLTDAFTIGGTKMGALFGEAVVIQNPALQKDFRYLIKQRGGMFAKGRLLGLQFQALFTDDLYFRLARHANAMAAKLREGLTEKGYPFFVDSPTNQIFPILPKALLEALQEDFAWSFWQAYDETADVIRLCTSWATEESQVDAFLSAVPGAD